MSFVTKKGFFHCQSLTNLIHNIFQHYSFDHSMKNGAFCTAAGPEEVNAATGCWDDGTAQMHFSIKVQVHE